MAETKDALKAHDDEHEQVVDEHGPGVDRRTVIKVGAAAGAAAAIVTPKRSRAQGSPYPPPPPPPPSPMLCDTPANSPPTTPFVDDLPIPTPASPTHLFPYPTRHANVAAGEAARDPHQAWFTNFPQVFYESVAGPSLHTFHSELSPTYLWTFDGQYPGPTFLGHYGIPQLVRFRNNLPVDNPTAGINQLTVHLHNGHTPSESDGFAADFYDPGLWKDNHYANVYAGVEEFGGIGDPREAMHTFWYHDHRAEFTAPNNYLGLNGQFYLYDAKDPGHEFDSPESLRLPGYYGVTDIPIHLHAILFCPDEGQGRNEAFITATAPQGVDKWIVNGKIQPKMTVRRRKYRFRIVNTGVVKEWNIRFIGPDGQQAPMTVTALEANLLEQPVSIDDRTLKISVASRADVIVDFSQFPDGSSVYFIDDAPQFVGVSTADPAPGLAIENVAARFDVVEPESWFPPDTPPVPSQLTQYPDPIVPDDFFQWDFTFDPTVSPPFRINGEVFDHNRIDHAVLKGSSEEWIIANDVIASRWTHPVHVHLEEGRIMSRTVAIRDENDEIIELEDVPLLPEEKGRRDIYNVRGDERMTIRLRFRDFVGRYLIHCHNMNHEDLFMMVRWDVVDTVEELTRVRGQINERRMLAGLPPRYEERNGRLVSIRPRSKNGGLV